MDNNLIYGSTVVFFIKPQGIYQKLLPGKNYFSRKIVSNSDMYIFSVYYLC